MAPGGPGREAILVCRDPGDAEPRSGEGLGDFDALVAAADAPPREVGAPRADECMCYIYTSGTTGLPKAAVIRNSRWLLAGALFGSAVLELGRGDVVYIALPLYHSNAMFGGWGAAPTTGAAMALRRKFSAPRFWRDGQASAATAFVYIGALCRYPLHQPGPPVADIDIPEAGQTVDVLLAADIGEGGPATAHVDHGLRGVDRVMQGMNEMLVIRVDELRGRERHRNPSSVSEPISRT